MQYFGGELIAVGLRKVDLYFFGATPFVRAEWAKALRQVLFSNMPPEILRPSKVTAAWATERTLAAASRGGSTILYALRSDILTYGRDSFSHLGRYHGKGGLRIPEDRIHINWRRRHVRISKPCRGR